MISVTALADTRFCERCAYIKHVLRLPPPDPSIYVYGSIKHAALEEVSKSHTREEMVEKALKALEKKKQDMLLHGLDYNELVQEVLREIHMRPERQVPFITERFISSKELGFRGRVDRIEVLSNSFIPHEYKSRYSEARLQRDLTQLVAYGMLIETEWQKQSPYGMLDHAGNCTRIDFTDKLKQDVLACRDAFTELARGREPRPSNKCSHCMYSKYCQTAEY